MNTQTAEHTPQHGEVLIPGKPTFHSVSDAVSRIVEGKTPRAWWILFGLNAAGVGMLLVAIAYLVWEGIGVWGLMIPVGWGFDITNLVFWIGIGHAGTLISAILFLLRQRWRTSINRFAEAMTIFAVICALLFPTIHVGRIWVLYFVLPIPNQMGAWPNFRSPLLWDFFAFMTYFTVSVLFWYVGLIPDLATLRDRAQNKIKKIIFGVLSLGWLGGNKQWKHYELAYLVLAALATPLVLSVHSIVSMDFSTSILPGWHTTIFPPYFVAGAIFSGFAMVMTLAVMARTAFGLQDIFNMRVLERMNLIMLVTGSMVGYAYVMEFFTAWYSGNEYELFAFTNRAFGPYAWAYWIMVSCNVLVPQLFWSKKLRTNIAVMFVASLLINVGMWFERFVIMMTLSRDFLPSAWDYYTPTKWEIMTLIGSFCLFFALFLLFLRFLPMVAMSEVKGVLPEAQVHHQKHHAQAGSAA